MTSKIVPAEKTDIEIIKNRIQKKNDTDLKSQIVTSSWGGTRKMPYAFTEYGIAMLSSVLHSRDTQAKPRKRIGYKKDE